MNIKALFKKQRYCPNCGWSDGDPYPLFPQYQPKKVPAKIIVTDIEKVRELVRLDGDIYIKYYNNGNYQLAILAFWEKAYEFVPEIKGKNFSFSFDKINLWGVFKENV